MRADIGNWLVKVGDITGHEYVIFNRQHLSMVDVKAALRAQYPDVADFVVSDHGSMVYVGRKPLNEPFQEGSWVRVT